MSGYTYTKRQRLNVLRSQLELEQASFLSHWKDIARVVRPRRYRNNKEDNNKGDRQNRDIIDGSGVMASRALRAGLLSGIMSPARKWFRLSPPDPEMLERPAVKSYVHAVTDRILIACAKSNVYQNAPIFFGDCGDFGTGAMLVEEDFTGKYFRTYTFPIGSYRIANDENMEVRVFQREFRLTVRQLLAKFGRKIGKDQYDWSNFSDAVRTAYENKNFETWIDVCHVIEPNPDYNPANPTAKHKRYSSCYYEMSSTGPNAMREDEDKYLRESGYDYFPVLVARWEVSGEDVYGTDCPGMTALGDIRQLQQGEKKALKAIDKMIDPPMQGPPDLLNKRISILPGDFTATTSRDGQQGLRPVHEVNFRLEAMENKQAQVRNRIDEAYYKNILLMFSSDDRAQARTAIEVSEKREERFLALGHAYLQLEQEFLKAFVEIAFLIMQAQGAFDDLEVPEELSGVDLKTEFLSVMSQAQKIVGLSTVERYLSIAERIGLISQGSLDKTNFEEILDVVGDMTSIPPKIVRPDEEVEAMRAAKAEAQAQANQMAAIQQAAATAKDLGSTPMDSDNALTRLTDQANAGRLV